MIGSFSEFIVSCAAIIAGFVLIIACIIFMITGHLITGFFIASFIIMMIGFILGILSLVFGD